MAQQSGQFQIDHNKENRTVVSDDALSDAADAIGRNVNAQHKSDSGSQK